MYEKHGRHIFECHHDSANAATKRLNNYVMAFHHSGRFGSIFRDFESLWDVFPITFAMVFKSSWDHVGITLRSFGGPLGITLESFPLILNMFA